jgi:TPR repeat protein
MSRFALPLFLALGLGLANGGLNAQSARQLTRKVAPPPPSPAPATPPSKGTPSPAARPAPAPAPAAPAIPATPARPVDPAKAKAQQEEVARKTLEFQKKRAAEGHASAQYELGLRYLSGDGVERNEAEGRKWLELAAKGNHTLAIRKLEELKPSSK